MNENSKVLEELEEKTRILADKEYEILIENDSLMDKNDFIQEEITAIKVNKDNFINARLSKYYGILLSIVVLNPVVASLFARNLSIGNSLPLGLLFGGIETVSIIGCGVLPLIVENIYKRKFKSDAANLETLEHKLKKNEDKIIENRKQEKEIDKLLDDIKDLTIKLDSSNILLEEDVEKNETIRNDVMKLTKKLK